jgi:uncharacterized protein with HEPN domain
MLNAVRQIQDFTAETTYDQYQQDLKLRLALTRLIEIVGEASNRISNETKALFTDIEWNVLYGIRNVLAHEYFGIDYDIIWITIQKDIPTLRFRLENMVLHLNSPE